MFDIFSSIFIGAFLYSLPSTSRKLLKSLPSLITQPKGSCPLSTKTAICNRVTLLVLTTTNGI